MKLITNSQRILAELFKQDFADNEIYSDESQYFEFFSAKNILKNLEFSDEEIESGVIGSGNDGGCDSIYTLCNKSYLQGYHKEKPPKRNWTAFFIPR